METDQLWDLFKIDQQRISALDTILIAIRGWTVTVVSAIAGFSLSKNDHSILLAAMGGTVFFGVLDVEYRRTQLFHVKRATMIERQIAPDYPLRPPDSRKTSGDPGSAPENLRWDQELGNLIRRYLSSILFYAVVLLVLLAIWLWGPK
jgi:hypothetical protein